MNNSEPPSWSQLWKKLRRIIQIKRQNLTADEKVSGNRNSLLPLAGKWNEEDFNRNNIVDTLLKSLRTSIQTP